MTIIPTKSFTRCWRRFSPQHGAESVRMWRASERRPRLSPEAPVLLGKMHAMGVFPGRRWALAVALLCGGRPCNGVRVIVYQPNGLHCRCDAPRLSRLLDGCDSADNTRSFKRRRLSHVPKAAMTLDSRDRAVWRIVSRRRPAGRVSSALRQPPI